MVIAVTFQRLIEDAARDWTLEEELVLQALRRSTRALETASAQELSDYLGALSQDQLRGVASNVKGIYHELLFVQSENGDWDQVSAKVKEFTNHPGGDVEFVVDGNAIGEVQLKAVASEAQVLEHLARYPDIDVRVTEEVAARMPGIESSGFSNNELTRDVYDRLAELQGDGLVDEIGEGLATSSLVSSAIIAGKAVRGQHLSGSEIRSFLVDAGIGATTAAVLDILLLPITT
ncbi:hypothetical protein [Lutimaribacter pacificus]|uniref:hypothetical protein n=1 Tax=Lutimaribacter pacificus TaxID=391948 RepID=UPI00122C4D87|nr:hypothetical protein [Lutimaribacter pacificus]